MRYKYILSIDPSGAFNEGKGTTGYCIFNTERMQVEAIGQISASNFKNVHEYWEYHLSMITVSSAIYPSLAVVLEDYLLYGDKAQSQTNSRMETPQLIGAIKTHCAQLECAYFIQPAAQVKKRWSDEILTWKGYIKKQGRGYKVLDGTPVNRHVRDAIRHAVHFATFKNEAPQLN